jgi:DNA-binding transcriptional LysR family regulator
MDLRQIRHFVAVADELHFGQAAARLGMTQPPLSQSIRALEDDLGVRLFTRTKRSVALTPVGELWLVHARRLLADAEGLPQIAARLSRGEIGSLRLSFVSTAVYGLLPTLISRYKQAFPEVDIALIEATSDIQIQALLEGEIDAGLIIPPPGHALPPPLAYRPVQRDPLIAVVPEAWCRNGRIGHTNGELTLARIASEPLILFPRGSAPALHDLVMGYFAEHDLKPVLGQPAVQMQTIVALVSVGLGFSLVPEAMRSLARAGSSYIPLAGNSPVVETGLIWRRDNTPPAVNHLVRLTA